MKFGLFGSALAKRGGPDLDSSLGFKEYVDYTVEAEALGYTSIFTVEHHFTGFGQVSATLSLLTFVAARTTALRLGTAVRRAVEAAEPLNFSISKRTPDG
jgi:alkanesulfonate monooxygenase SsuD/methylene tetrahydromethanopterin reductase-like flavin-dependent oxidoreductase (luciferase family)